MRLLVCDPVCVQAFGHNVPALNYFNTAFRASFPDSLALCGKDLPQAVARKHGFERFYRHCYDAYIPVDRPDDDREPPVDAGLHFDPLEAVATEDAERLLATFGVGRDDTVFFPSVDFYGAIGLMNALRGRPAAQQPRVLMRFIGVMEHASHSHRDPAAELLARIRGAVRAGTRVSVSAETPRLADALAMDLALPVTATPYPSVATPSAVPEDGPFVCFCPGSARLDKGFLALHDIFAKVRVEDPDLTIRFVVQDLPIKDAGPHQTYVSRLYAIPGVEILPPQISEEEMAARYRACSLVLLPYDAQTYRHRGSAAMMEAACFGRPVIAYDRCAFSEQVRYFQLGEVVSSGDAMAEAVRRLSRLSPQRLTLQAMQARHRFVSDAVDSYARWFRELA